MNSKDIILIPIQQGVKLNIKRGIPYIFLWQVMFLIMKVYAVTAGIAELSWPWFWVFIPIWILPAIVIGIIGLLSVGALLAFLGMLVYYSIQDLKRKRKINKHDKTRSSKSD